MDTRVFFLPSQTVHAESFCVHRPSVIHFPRSFFVFAVEAHTTFIPPANSPSILGSFSEKPGVKHFKNSKSEIVD